MEHECVTCGRLWTSRTAADRCCQDEPEEWL